MSNYAFLDQNRTKKVYAKDAMKQNKSTRYYCPNPNCNAHMYICNVKGVSSAYFSANHKRYPHIDHCPYGARHSFKSENYEEALFQFEHALESLTFSNIHKREKKYVSNHKINRRNDLNIKRRPLRSIRQIYDMCKSLDINASYNGVKIGDMILDDRSVNMYPRQVIGYKIIEGRASNYFYYLQRLEIKIEAPLGTRNYIFFMRFCDERLFKEIRSMIFNNKDKVIVVSGNWKGTYKENHFFTELTNKKQIAII